MNTSEYIIYPGYGEYLVGKVTETYPSYRDDCGVDMPGGYKISVVFLFNWRENIKEKYFSDGAIVIKTTKEKWKYDIIRYCLK